MSISSSGSGILGAILKLIDFQHSFMGYSRSTVLIILLLIGIALVYRGSESWMLIFGAFGAYVGFIISLYISSLLNISNSPIYLIMAIGAVMGAILMLFFVRTIISAILGFAGFTFVYVAFGLNIIIAGLIGIVIFAVAYVFNRKLIIYIAAILGAIAIWFSLSNMGLSNILSQFIAIIAFISGIYIQTREEEKGNNRYYYRDPPEPPYYYWE
ncbi:MAG: hypothetical protein ACYDAO_05480 [Thermoplasmataceae archaeon]